MEFVGTLQVPGDKSISHRALMFSLLANGACTIRRLSPAEDCQSTARCLRQLGVTIDADPREPGRYTVLSAGTGALKTPQSILDAGNSGTTIRLLSGLLAGTAVRCRLTGDDSLQKRPMARVLNPLAEMGATFKYIERDGYPPFELQGCNLTGKTFELAVASAQVQTALLLAGLHAEGETRVTMPAVARDHTERMFSHIGVPYEKPDALTTVVKRLEKPVAPFEISVAADISSAAFFLVAAVCAAGSRLVLPDVGMNAGRTLVLDVLAEMGASIEIGAVRNVSGEPVSTLVAGGGAPLKGTMVAGDLIAAGIDEIPILALAGAFSHGTFSVRDAAELRVKESDRLSAIVENLRAAGANVTEYPDGFDIIGSGKLKGGSLWKTHGDHRLAMTAMVASLLCDAPLQIDDTACAAVSYPHFATDLHSLQA